MSLSSIKARIWVKHIRDYIEDLATKTDEQLATIESELARIGDDLMGALKDLTGYPESTMSEERIDAAIFAFHGVSKWPNEELTSNKRAARTQMRAALDAADATEASPAQALADDIEGILSSGGSIDFDRLQDALQDWKKATGQ